MVVVDVDVDVVVEVPADRTIERLDPFDVVALLGEHGPVAKALGGYEDRQSQRDDEGQRQRAAPRRQALPQRFQCAQDRSLLIGPIEISPAAQPLIAFGLPPLRPRTRAPRTAVAGFRG